MAPAAVDMLTLSFILDLYLYYAFDGQQHLFKVCEADAEYGAKNTVL